MPCGLDIAGLLCYNIKKEDGALKKKIIITVTVAAILLCAISIPLILIHNGIILLNNPSESEYPIRGVDVSAYQGEIDWATLSSQNIDFAFIKATEGSSFVDSKFAYNFAEAQKHGISVGAYHFFSYESAGKTQAENFIRNVTPFEGMLPPVIDLEFYGGNDKNPPKREDVTPELKDFISEIEAYYGLRPIIYVTEKSYRLYLSGDYEEYDIWIRNVLTKPTLSDGREWTFWQVTSNEILDGYNGKERFIDVNVFCGTDEEFAKYPKYKKEN